MLTPQQTAFIDFARKYAEEKHAGQTYGDGPYTLHLSQVAVLVEKHATEACIGNPAWWIAAAWLHDVLEDTGATYDDLCRTFGHTVADAVAFCSDSPGVNRKERKAATYKRWLNYTSPVSLGGSLVKLCDRLSNIMTASTNHLKMYQNEHAAFEKAIRGHLTMSSGATVPEVHTSLLYQIRKALAHRGAAIRGEFEEKN